MAKTQKWCQSRDHPV